jgi:hypothetical protein
MKDACDPINFPLLPMPIFANRFPNTQYLPSRHRPNGNYFVTENLLQNHSFPMLPTVGDESNVEHIL